MNPLRAVADREVSIAAPELVEVEARPLGKCTSHAAKVPKPELEELLRDAGYGGPEQGREAARYLRCDEKTLRRWRDDDCRKDLAPDEIRVILKGRAAELRRENARTEIALRRAS